MERIHASRPSPRFDRVSGSPAGAPFTILGEVAAAATRAQVRKTFSRPALRAVLRVTLPQGPAIYCGRRVNSGKSFARPAIGSRVNTISACRWRRAERLRGFKDRDHQIVISRYTPLSARGI